LASPRAVHAPGNLPVELTSFVGRRQGLSELKRTLASARLLTLTGAGGVGKTRLALRAARESARMYPDGVWFVELAPVRDPDLVPQAVITALGLQDHSSSRATSTVGAFLGDKRPLLILDNCEHVHDAAALLAGTLLRACPDVRILATSRQALGVMGEVPTLSLPDDPDSSPEALLRSDAVALFVERATAVQPAFAIDGSNAAAVLRICTQVDGIPLALELAAVRLSALGLDALDRGLSARLGALGTGDRSAAPRQQTLDAAIDWSYRLLSEAEREVWTRLSVFAGGFELRAAEAVCAGDGIEAMDIPEVVASLAEQSVVKRVHGDTGDRFRLLEPLRLFGLERLRESQAEQRMRSQHADWIAGLARAVAAEDEHQPALFRQVKAERANVWAAIDFCLADPAEATRGATICGDLWEYWACQGPVSEVRRVLGILLPSVPAATRARARANAAAGMLAMIQNDYAASRDFFAEVGSVGRAARDADAVAWSLACLSSIAWAQGDPVASVAFADEGLALARSMHLRRPALRALTTRGYAALAGGDLDGALAFAREGVALSEELGETWERGILFQLLAGASLARGRLDEAATYGQRAAGFEHDLDDRVGLAHTVALLGAVEMARGAAVRAATLLGGSEGIFRSIPSSLMVPFEPMQQRAVEDARTRLGAAGYRAAHDMGLVMTPDEILTYVTDGRVAGKAEPVAPVTDGPLSRREREVAALVSDGASNAQVAARLFISERTVESHMASIFNKLGVDTRLQVARWFASTQESTIA
jgi:predicted ATPase/DNA-binding CsgD family transcriptional regulator